MRAVELVNVGIEASTGAPLVLLREHDEPHRLLPVFIGGVEASSIAIALGDEPPLRPMTHDLLLTLVEQFGAELDRVELTRFEDEMFFADLVVVDPAGERRIDARPSDALALAVRTGAPVLVSDDVLDEAGALPEPVESADVDPADIDDEVDRFRAFLGDVDPSDFALPENTQSDDPPADDAPTD